MTVWYKRYCETSFESYVNKHKVKYPCTRNYVLTLIIINLSFVIEFFYCKRRLNIMSATQFKETETKCAQITNSLKKSRVVVLHCDALKFHVCLSPYKIYIQSAQIFEYIQHIHQKSHYMTFFCLTLFKILKMEYQLLINRQLKVISIMQQWAIAKDVVQMAMLHKKSVWLLTKLEKLMLAECYTLY